MSLIFLLLSFLLTACGGAATPPGETPPAAAQRQAMFSLVLNEVQARLTADADLKPAVPGDRLQVGGQARSGETGRARLDLQPDGTIVRLAPNTLFTLQALEAQAEAPFSRLRLELGRLWVILNGGSLEVETPYGVAAVRGSYLSVSFDEAHGMVVTCLEGRCSLSNAAGAVELTDGQTASIAQPDAPPSPPQPMQPEDYQAWEQASPEAVALLHPETQNAPRSMPDGSPLPEQAEGPVNTRPFSFELRNNCPAEIPEGGDWVWQFERLPDASGAGFVETVTVSNGQTVSGTLPPGQYIITDWFATGEQHGPQKLDSDKAPTLQVQNCRQ